MAVVVALPGKPEIELTHLALDLNGTLAREGHLLPGVAERLVTLSHVITIIVMTADTRGTALQELAGLPVETRLVATGTEKARLVQEIGPSRVAAVGNGRNDVAMVKLAALSIAVLGPEGTAAELIPWVNVVAPDISVALDLLTDPVRLVATLRA
jgi:soluble P-type ATPase